MTDSGLQVRTHPGQPRGDRLMSWMVQAHHGLYVKPLLLYTMFGLSSGTSCFCPVVTKVDGHPRFGRTRGQDLSWSTTRQSSEAVDASDTPGLRTRTVDPSHDGGFVGCSVSLPGGSQVDGLPPAPSGSKNLL